MKKAYNIQNINHIDKVPLSVWQKLKKHYPTRGFEFICRFNPKKIDNYQSLTFDTLMSRAIKSQLIPQISDLIFYEKGSYYISLKEFNNYLLNTFNYEPVSYADIAQA